MTKCIYAVCLLSVVIMTKHATAYYDAVVVDSDGKSEDTVKVVKLPINPRNCLLPKSIGPCRGFFPSYYYDGVSKKCELFVWSGCGGNNNRFDSLESCQKQCLFSKAKRGSEKNVKCCDRREAPPLCNKGCSLKKDSCKCPTCDCSTRKKVCYLPAVRGHCRALLPRWRYDPTTGRCIEFKFGGCNGNGNNFRTLRKCMKTCGGQYNSTTEALPTRMPGVIPTTRGLTDDSLRKQ